MAAMSRDADKKLIAVINTSIEFVEVLEMALIESGYRTVSLLTLIKYVFLGISFLFAR